MKQVTFKQKIFRLVVGVVGLTAFLILLTVWKSTAEHAEKQLSEDLTIARSVLSLVLEERIELLRNSADILTRDFGFIRAVASKDTPTIESVLSNHGARIDADIMSLLSLQGNVIAGTQSLFEGQDATLINELVKQAIQNGAASKITVNDHRLYQLIFTTVKAPSTPIAIAVVGFEIDKDILLRLEEITQLNTQIYVTTEHSHNFIIGGALDNNATQEDVVAVDLDMEPVFSEGIDVTKGKHIPWLKLIFSGEKQRIESSFVLVARDELEIRISVSTSSQRIFSSFLTLPYTITIIALLAMLFAIAMAYLLSRQVAKPIEHITCFAKRIASGNYESDIKIDTKSQELNDLANAFNKMQTNIQLREQKIVYQAQSDELTGLYNRNYVEFYLTDKFTQKECFQTVGINIFGFRDINDTFGYHNGDFCLKELANRMREFGGLSARLTGGELLWVPDLPASQSELEIIREKLQRDIYVDGLSIPLRVTIGVIECPSDTHNAEDLFRRMNIVLDEAQNSEEKLLRFDPSFESSYLRRLSIITELKKALSSNQHELQLFYQPKMDLKSDQILAVEALIRWQNDKLGFISPEDFIAIAEHAGFINKITEWVYHQAVQDVCAFKAQGVNVSVAINISAQDIVNKEQLELINKLLQRYSLPSEALSFELTEGDLIKDPELALQHLGYLRDAGFNIAIDDFGTGYSSLAYLTQLPVNVLKIDKSFVLNLDTSPGDQTIVKTVIKLAHSFGMEVVAEGVENETSLGMLRDWGCEWAQGYHICRPIAANDFIKWYKEYNSAAPSSQKES